jgi:hypothetical protein
MTSPKSKKHGRAMSPVIRANSKFYGFGRAICVDVRFRSIEQLDALIVALRKLREFPRDGYDHVHVQDTRPRKLGAAEVTLWHPSARRTSGDYTCLKAARAALRGIAPE